VPTIIDSSTGGCSTEMVGVINDAAPLAAAVAEMKAINKGFFANSANLLLSKGNTVQQTW